VKLTAKITLDFFTSKINMYSPLDQFENTLIKPFFFFSVDFSLTFFSVSLFFLTFFIVSVFIIMFSNPFLIPKPFQYIGESIYEFVYFVQKSQTGHKGRLFFPFFLTIFIFIFCSNLLGLIPYSFTPTAQLVIPLFLSFLCNFSFILIGLYRYRHRFFKLFVPSGVSIYLIPLITLIEFSTYILRTFSLALRLFANIIAGHTLLFICISSVSATYSIGSFFGVLLTFSLVFAVYILELLIAFLQAYVFLVLLSVYLVDSLNSSSH
jgi:F-type H+-transporting ATPase subunit a